MIAKETIKQLHFEAEARDIPVKDELGERTPIDIATDIAQTFSFPVNRHDMDKFVDDVVAIAVKFRYRDDERGGHFGTY